MTQRIMDVHSPENCMPQYCGSSSKCTECKKHKDELTMFVEGHGVVYLCKLFKCARAGRKEESLAKKISRSPGIVSADKKAVALVTKKKTYTASLGQMWVLSGGGKLWSLIEKGKRIETIYYKRVAKVIPLEA